MSEEVPETLWGRIKYARTRRGMSRRALADRAGLRHTALDKCEAEGGNPTANTLRPIARELGVTTDWIVNGGPWVFADWKAAPPPRRKRVAGEVPS